MAERTPELLQRKIACRLSFYEDLGIKLFYRDRKSGLHEDASSIGFVPAVPAEEEIPLQKTVRKPEMQRTVPVPAPKVTSLPATAGPTLFEAVDKIAEDSLLRIREDLGECTRCKLHSTRHTIVFGDGSSKAELVFVGEGPGADEDAQGLPFVGRAGKLLTQMIEAMGLQRKDVYICNVVKCRPPGNRQPEEEEVSTCSPFLLRQIDVIAPKVIVCLGAVAAKTLLQTNRGISQFRGEWLDFRGKKLLATYHPAYLLRNPAAKSEVWKDLQKVMAVLGLEVKKGKPAGAGKSA
ncbi:MAG TPA: uracil-DNA glycosylase [Candidatus Acidoferrum sp.]|nr:uracil-DNA glycosylase [Candidatus Acidoferrum sp.]